MEAILSIEIFGTVSTYPGFFWFLIANLWKDLSKSAILEDDDDLCLRFRFGLTLPALDE